VHGQAARHADRLPGDESGIVAGQEAHRARNILGLADAFHRNGADQGRAHLLPALVVAGTLERSPDGLPNVIAGAFEPLAAPSSVSSRDFR